GPASAVLRISAVLLESECAICACEDVDAIIAIRILQGCEHFIAHGSADWCRTSSDRVSQHFNCECYERDPGNRKQYGTSPEETEASDVNHGVRGARIEIDSSGNLGNGSGHPGCMRDQNNRCESHEVFDCVNLRAIGAINPVRQRRCWRDL